jgi:hypothetical protein
VQDKLNKLRLWYYAAQAPELRGRLRDFVFVCGVAEAIGRTSALCAVLVVVVCVPLYSACSHYYGTVTYQYAYTVSALYQAGAAPFALDFTVYVVVLVFFLLTLQKYKNTYVKQSVGTEEAPTADKNSEVHASKVQIYCAYATFFAINFVLVIGVNVTFVYIALYESTALLALAQLFLSFFKGFWNSVGAMYLMRWSFNTVATNDTTRADFINTQLFVSLMNNIAIPCLVVAAVSPDCFYNLFVPAPAVTVYYVYLYCGIFEGDRCVFYYPTLASSSYSPPFTYSYQCGAQYIQAYAPTFVYLAIEVAFISPALQIALQQLHERATPGTMWHRFLDYWSYKNMKPLVANASGKVERDVYEPFFDANQLIVLLLTYLGIILTFGVVFPPLAVVMMVAVVSLVVTNRLIMGRYICAALKLQQEEALGRPTMASSPAAPSLGEEFLAAIELDSRGVGSLHLRKLRTAVWMIVWFCCFFYALYGFETLGNSLSLQSAIWAFLAIPLLPIALYVAMQISRRRVRAGVLEELNRLTRYSVELRPSTMGAGADRDKSQASGSPEVVSPLAQKKKSTVVVDETFITVDLHHNDA